MTEPIEDTQVWTSEDVDAARRDVEEEDESGAPEKVAWPEVDNEHPLESEEALREPREIHEEEADRAPQSRVTKPPAENG